MTTDFEPPDDIKAEMVKSLDQSMSVTYEQNSDGIYEIIVRLEVGTDEDTAIRMVGMFDKVIPMMIGPAINLADKLTDND